MRRRPCRALALFLALAQFLTACGGRGEDREPGEGECALWFTAAHGSPGSAALGREIRDVSAMPPGETVLGLLLKGPEDPELTSPFPAGTTGTWRAEEGTAYVDLSEAYGGLSGAELTLADACIVLTLCQFEQVERVYITVAGEARPFRDQVFTPEDFLLDNTLGETE